MRFKYLKKASVISAIGAAFLGLFGACDNPFSNSLGEKVDVFPPLITVGAPISGEYIKGTTTFTGHATASQNLRSIEVKIFDTDEKKPPILDWTTTGITLTGSLKEKNWSFDLDTLNYFSQDRGLSDGLLKMQFRAHDPSQVTETVELVYIVKNKPSDVKLTSPNILDPRDPVFVPQIITGEEIRGQITDRRGIMPGYPKIKFWLNGTDEPDDDQWAALFLPGDTLKGYDDPYIAQGYYSDRYQFGVIRAANFSFPLFRYTVDSGKIKYELDGEGNYIPLDLDVYNFRIITCDTYFDEQQKPLPPNGTEIVGYFPPENFGDSDNENNTVPRDLPLSVELKSSAIRPTVELDNSDVSPVDLASRPNIYINAPTSRKIAVGRDLSPGRVDFRLRVLATHPENIDNATLYVTHSSIIDKVYLKWDDVPGGQGYVNPADDYTSAKEGYRGILKNPANGAEGKLFTFSGYSGMLGTDEAALGQSRSLFTTSSELYTLVVTAVSGSGISTEQSYVLYMDGDGPSVSIRSIKGAAGDSDGSGNLDNVSGGVINERPFIVNGNIQVSIDRIDDSGIMANKDAVTPNSSKPDSYPLVKWIVEEDIVNGSGDSIYLASAGTVLQKLRKYRAAPASSEMGFFDSVTDPSGNVQVMEGWVNLPDPASSDEINRTNNFKFNTWKDSGGPNPLNTNLWDKKSLWMYVIAQDGVQNLGFILQKIYIDDETDIPVLSIPVFSEKNGSGDPINSPDKLYAIVDADENLSGNVDAAGMKTNVLEKYQGIELNLTDDDGINLKTGVTITLTDLNDSSVEPKTISAADLNSLLKDPNKTGSETAGWVGRDWTGVITQEFMGQLLYGEGSSHLPDGMFMLTITVADDVNYKVAITGGSRPGDQPGTASGSNTFYFAVSTEMPEIEVHSPAENDFLNNRAIDITGSVKSRLKIQRLWITFSPNVLQPGDATEELALYSDQDHTLPVTQLADIPMDSQGYYVYYWQRENVNFDLGGFTGDQRHIVLKAYDGVGNVNEYTRTILIDTTPPQVDIIETNNGRAEKWHGKVTFTITASDTNGLADFDDDGNAIPCIRWWLIPIGSPDPGWDTPFPDPEGATGRGGEIFISEGRGGRYTGVVDTRGLDQNLVDKPDASDPSYVTKLDEWIGDGGYKLCVIAVDRAGNYLVPPVTSYNAADYDSVIKVDQSKDLPEIDTDTLLPGLGNVSGAQALRLQGTVSDDDLFDANKLGNYVKIRFPATFTESDGKAVTWGEWIPVPVTLDPAGALRYNFNFSDQGGLNAPQFNNYFVRSDGTTFIDGPKYYQIMVTDEPDKAQGGRNYGKNPLYPPYGDKTGQSDYVAAVSKIFPGDTEGYDFVLVTTPPEIYFNKYDPNLNHANFSTGRPTFQNRNDITNPSDGNLSGTVESGYLASVSLIYGTETNEFDLSSYTAGYFNWTVNTSWLIAFDTAPQGLQSVTIEATDIAGNTARVSWVFYKDTQGPDIFLDNIGRAILRPAVANPSAPPPTLPGIPAAVDFPANWPSDWPSASPSADWQSWSAGWKATIANWPSEYAFFADTVDQATGTVTKTKAAKVIEALTAENERNPSVISGDENSVSVMGKFVDALSSVWFASDNTGNVNDLPLFYYRFDSAGRDGGSVLSWPSRHIEKPETGQRNDTAVWVIPIPPESTPFADGEHTLDIGVPDKAGNIAEIYGVRFIVDRNNPVMSEPIDMKVDGPGGGAVLEDGTSVPFPKALEEVARVFSAASVPAGGTNVVFTLNGEITENNLSDLTASISSDNSNAPVLSTGIVDKNSPTPAFTEIPVWYSGAVYNSVDTDGESRLSITGTTTPYLWNWTLKILEKDINALQNLSNTNDGTRRSVTMIATDKARRSSGRKVWRFYLDSVEPVIEYTNMEKGPSFTIFESAGSSISLQGIASDDTKIRDVKFSIAKWDYSLPSTGGWTWYNGTAWTATQPSDSLWPSLLNIAGEPDYNPSTTVNWTLTQAKLNKIIIPGTINTPAYPADLFSIEGQYKIDLCVTDWSISSSAASVGNPHKTSADTTYADAGYTYNSVTGVWTGSASARKFFIDLTDPAIRWAVYDSGGDEWIATDTNPYYRSNASGSVEFSFTVSDPNTIVDGDFRVDVINAGKATVASLVNTPPNANIVIEGDSWSTTGRTVTVSPDMTGQPYGTYTLVLTVKDGAGKQATADTTLQFTLDNDPPEFKNINPSGGTAAVAGRVAVNGSITENTNLIDKVAFYVANAGDTWGAPDPAHYGDPDYGWHYWEGTTGGAYYQITYKDDANNDRQLIGIDNGVFTWNVTVPNTRNFHESVEGPAYIREFTTDASGIPNDAAWTEGALKWNGENIVSDTVYKLVIYFMAEDAAGNIQLEQKTYWIYPEGDRPVLSISNPDESRIEAERLLNGRIRVAGMARDNETIRRVWFRVLNDNTGDPGSTDPNHPRPPYGQPYTNLTIPNWNTDTWEAATAADMTAFDASDPEALRKIVDNRTARTDPRPDLTGGGWYIANGGMMEGRQTSSISWWVYINAEGELDPDGGGSNKILIQARAEDSTWDDILNAPNGDWTERGMISKAGTEVNAFVVAGAPQFENEQVMMYSGAPGVWVAGTWGDVISNNISGRAAYRIIAKDDSGLAAIRWTPTRFTTTFASFGTMVNLLDPDDTYNSTTYAADLANMNGASPAGPGIAVKAEPRATVASGSLVTGSKYLIWKPDTGYLPPGVDLPGENAKYTAFEATGPGDPSSTAVFMEQTADGYYEWLVTVDVNTAILRSDLADGSPASVGKWAKDAVRYPVYLTATEISKSTPLTAARTAELPIDNLAPVAGNLLNRRLAGLAATAGGEAGDPGAVGGMSRVVVWFSRNINSVDSHVSWHELGTGEKDGSDTSNLAPITGVQGNATTGLQQKVTLKDGTEDEITMPLLGTLGNATGGDWAIVVYQNDPSGSLPQYGQKLAMGLASGGTLGTIWYVELNSLGLASGPITMHYVIYDRAGNARYYTERLVVMNDAPQIKQVKFGTDIRKDTALQNAIGPDSTGTNLAAKTGDGATPLLNGIRGGAFVSDADDVLKGITPWTPYYTGTYGGYREVNFNSRNNLLAFGVETTARPNEAKDRTFRFEYVSGAALVTDLSQIKAGKVYIINEEGSPVAPWGDLGASGSSSNWVRGFAFLAIINGTEANISWTPPASAWELSSLNAAAGNMALADAEYPSDNTIPTAEKAVKAEFVYKENAFNSSSYTNYIKDFNPSASYPPAVGVNPTQDFSLFALTVFDGPEVDVFADFALFNVRVNNDDKTPPHAQLYDLNPLTEGQNSSLSKEDALNPGYIGDNRLRGGLWNTKSVEEVVKSGHIEPRRIGAGTTGNPYRHPSLTSSEMGGAATQAAGTVRTPWANPAAFFDYDTVSGQVILRGYAEDDQRVEQVHLDIGGQNVIILEYAANAPNIDPAGPPTTGFLSVPAAQAGKVFYTDDVDLYRHRVEWAYVWDTEAVPSGTVAGSANVRAISYNENSGAVLPATTNKASPQNNAPATGTEGVANNYNYIQFNIRPYITGFMRNKDLFYHDNRSLQGWNAFSRGEVVVVKGFNLGKTGTNTIISLSTATNIPAATATEQSSHDLDVSALPLGEAHYRYFTVSDTAIFGSVTLSAGAFPAANTGSERRTVGGSYWPQPWNTERSPGLEGSDLWDDYTAAHIWQSNDTGTANNAGNNTSDRGSFRSTGQNWMILNPSMSIDPKNGNLYSSHNEGGSGGSGTGPNANGQNTNNAAGTGGSNQNTGTLRITDNGPTGYNHNVMQFIDPVLYSDVYRSPGYGTAGEATWAVSSVIGRSGTSQDWTALGGILVYGPGGAASYLGNNATVPTLQTGYGHYLAESTWYNASSNNTAGVVNPPTTDQFMNPHIVTWGTGNIEHIHVSYYDDKDGSIKYRYNLRGDPGKISNGNGTNDAAVTANNAIPKMWTNLDGGLDAQDIDSTAWGAFSYTLQEANNGTAIGNGNRYVRNVYVSNGATVTAGQQIYRFGNNNNTPGNTTTINAPISGTISGLLATSTTTQTANTDIIFTITNGTSYSQGARVVNYSIRSASGASLIDAGKHNSIAVTNQGYPVIAYYDETNQKLKMAVSSSATPTLASNWAIIDNVIPAGNLNSFGTGEFVSLKIDTRGLTGAVSNRFHIAALNSVNKQLVYVTGMLTTASTLQDVTVQVVDSVGNVGRWCALSLDAAGNPWIAYQDEGYGGSMDGVKMAYLNSAQFSKALNDTYGVSIRGWETMHVPARYRVNNARVGLECYPTRNYTATTPTAKNWNAAVSYLSPDLYRIAYYVK